MGLLKYYLKEHEINSHLFHNCRLWSQIYNRCRFFIGLCVKIFGYLIFFQVLI